MDNLFNSFVDTQAPSAPSNLTGSSSSSSTVDLSWSASTDNVGVTGYTIYGNGTSYTTSGTSYTVTGLSSSTSYSFYVKARDAAGNYSSSSNTVSVTTEPKPPLNLRETSKTETSISIAWDVPQTDVYNFSIYVDSAHVGNTTGTTYTITGLSAGTTYNISVYTKDSNMSLSDPSTITSTTSDSGSTDYGSMGWSYMYTDSSVYNYISSGYKLPERSSHYGIDIISNDSSKPIYGVAIKNVYAGTVILANTENMGTGSAGNWVVVETNSIDPTTGKKLRVRYLHMKDAPLVEAEQYISAGTVVGYTGNTGDVDPAPTPENPTAGTHLHFDVNNNGKNSSILAEEAVNPQKFFPNINFQGKLSNLD